MRTQHARTCLLLVAVLLAGCLPAQLDKYRNEKSGGAPRAGGDESAPPSSAASKARAGRSEARSEGRGEGRQDPQQPPAPARATIYAVDRQTFRFALREGDVWESALSVLLHNYNLTIVDRQSGILSTEWDSYYLNNAVYRNKLSLRVARGGPDGRLVDVTIHNNVERLRDASQAAGTVGAVWLPAPDPANEVARVVQNMALVLNQPPPVLPPASAVARGSQTGPETLSR